MRVGGDNSGGGEGGRACACLNQAHADGERLGVAAAGEEPLEALQRSAFLPCHTLVRVMSESCPSHVRVMSESCPSHNRRGLPAAKDAAADMSETCACVCVCVLCVCVCVCVVCVCVRVSVCVW